MSQPMKMATPALKAVETTAEKYKRFVTNSIDLSLERNHFVVHGPSGHGKSVLAATGSKFAPEVLPHTGPLAVLDDMIWVAIDGGAADSLVPLGMYAPHVIDYKGVLQECGGDPIKAMGICLELARAAPQPKVVFDTISRWNDDTSGWLQRTENHHLWSNDKGVKDGFLFHRIILSSNQVMDQDARGMGKDLYYLFHSKLDAMPTKATEKEKAELSDRASALPGLPDILIEANGRARELFVKDASLIVAIRALEDPGRPGNFNRFVYTKVKEGLQAKSRWGAWLDEKEPAHLGLIQKKREAKLLAAKAALNRGEV